MAAFWAIDLQPGDEVLVPQGFLGFCPAARLVWCGAGVLRERERTAWP